MGSGWSPDRAGQRSSTPTPGDFVFVPKGAIHREGNPTGTDGDVIVVRVGHGPVVINVDGPAPTAP